MVDEQYDYSALVKSSHPAVILEHEMYIRGLTYDDLRIMIGKPKSFIRRFSDRDETARIDEHMAEQLQKHLNIPKELWLHYQDMYDYFVFHQSIKDVLG